MRSFCHEPAPGTVSLITYHWRCHAPVGFVGCLDFDQRVRHQVDIPVRGLLCGQVASNNEHPVMVSVHSHRCRVESSCPRTHCGEQDQPVPIGVVHVGGAKVPDDSVIELLQVLYRGAARSGVRMTLRQSAEEISIVVAGDDPATPGPDNLGVASDTISVSRDQGTGCEVQKPQRCSSCPERAPAGAWLSASRRSSADSLSSCKQGFCSHARRLRDQLRDRRLGSPWSWGDASRRIPASVAPVGARQAHLIRQRSVVQVHLGPPQRLKPDRAVPTRGRLPSARGPHPTPQSAG